MKKTRNALIAVLLIASLLMTLSACGEKKETSAPSAPPAAETDAAPAQSDDGAAQLPNPMREVDADRMPVETGIALEAPEGAENVKYFVIDDGAGGKIAQIAFRYNDKDYTYRAKADAEAMDDLSGAYYTWTETKEVPVAYCTATLQKCSEAAVVYWFDVVPGINYALTCTGDVEEDELCALAEQTFVPAQGDVDGDIPYFAEGEYANGDTDGHDTVTVTADGDGYTVNVSIFRLCVMDGIGTAVSGTLELNLTDPSGEKMSAVFYPDGESYTLRVTESTWGLLPADTEINGFVLG